MTEVQALIQTLATVESLTNEIDTLAVLDRQVKELEAKCKVLKDSIANTYGLCEKDANGKLIPHRGEKYGVKVTIADRKGSVKVAEVIKALGLTEEQFDAQFRGESSAPITVTCCA